MLEEFLIMVMNEKILPELKGVDFVTGPQQTFMSLAFMPKDFNELSEKPAVVLKTKDQDFTLGKELYFKFSTKSSFDSGTTSEGKLIWPFWLLSVKSI